MKQAVTRNVACFFLFSAMSATTSYAADKKATKSGGGKILENRCGRCHAIYKSGKSPLGNAPPLRDIYRQYPIERLEFELSEGIGSRHKNMPQIQFSSEQIDQILTYLKDMTETD